ncbi:hypothetical protein HOLleu_15076 [Holothuria leucospilota]|uniref:DNA-directed DNA polymerase n=1 Tax=Holothuria leucospilota TaxID=206669 RepID=A0A9Q1C9K6_HOLLE|nr:hypothetical protein HOLleu_15076 [Holothuria leucospilota]
MITWQEESFMCPENVTLPQPFGLAGHCDTHDLEKLYKKHWRDIRTRFQTKGRLRNTYNFRLHTFTTEEMMVAAKQIFERQETAFKINVGCGFFLRSVETCQLQYYYASNNTFLFPEPMLVTGRPSFTTFLNALSSKDPADYVRLARPNSRWVIEMVTNATFFVFKLRDHPIGGASRLPEFITNNKAIVSLERDRHNNYRYDDNLCLFRCLALHKGASVKTLEKKAIKLYRQMYSVKPKYFAGVPLSKLYDVETLFKVNIVVYQLMQMPEEQDKEKEDGESDLSTLGIETFQNSKFPLELTVRLIHRSLERYDDTMYLNLYEDHFSYIRDVNMYTKSYQCQKCQKLGSDRWHMQRHEATCDGVGVKHTFPGGVYSHPKTVFELLEEEGIYIPPDLRYYPYRACFKTFGDAVSDARREGDRDSSKAIIADTMKLIGNSSYGKTITNKEGHRNIHIVPEDKASRLINETTFRDLNEMSNGCYEVESAKPSIAMDLPIQIGFFVYQYAKLRMLEFYYDFLDKFFDRQYWEYVEMDTDSAYIAIAGDRLDDFVKPELRQVYEREKRHWFPRTDTEEHKRYDKRTPGLFKVQWEGDGIVALNSKMYYCFGGSKDKFSCKGINKTRNEVGKDMYLGVLNTKNPVTGENKGFRVKDNQVFTYSQVMAGFTYFYPKRKVLGNGVQTIYLDI